LFAEKWGFLLKNGISFEKMLCFFQRLIARQRIPAIRLRQLLPHAGRPREGSR